MGELRNISFKKTNYHSLIGSVLRNYPRDISGALALIAKGGIFLALALFFVLRKQKFSLIQLSLHSKKWILLLLLVQTIVIYTDPAYRYALIVYGYLFLVGIFPAKFFNSSYFRAEGYIWLFGPLMGLDRKSVV